MGRMKRYLGIDLGGCMSGTSAYCLIEESQEGFKIIESFKEPRHKNHHACHEFLTQAILRSSADKIGIDAPLSLPRKLYDKDFDAKEREAEGEIANPYLFRHTDYYLFKSYGLRPMPPAGDRIGRLTARALQLLDAAPIRGLRERIIEVYPKQIAQALGNVSYKKERGWVGKRLSVETQEMDEHQIDALLAAYAAMKIDQGFTKQAEDEDEGWCYPLHL